jgi:hypothetical protein
MVTEAWFSLLLLFGIAPAPAPNSPVVHQIQLDYNASELQHCLELQAYVRAMIDKAPMPSPFALALWADGKRMCEQGMVHGGISQLRMAARVLRASADGP